ncbi:MAG: acyl-CoA dehydrogenase [Alphaproteobacteria bacterium]|nr:acyl-CoA dehydrogenase [Alphaproteobacteria bacterium]
MNFDFSDDQKSLKDQARKVLTDKSSTKAVRAVLGRKTGTTSYDTALWKAVAELGWLGIAIPEEYGGVGLGRLELCVLAEELGRAVAPIPFASTVYFATEALLLAGSDAQKQKWLPKIASGEAIGCFALSEGPGAPKPEAMTTTFDGAALTGAKIPVTDGDIAHFAIVLAKEGGGASLAIAELGGVTRSEVKTLDPTRGHAKIEFAKTKAERLGKAGEGWELAEQVLDRAAVLLAFEQVGGAQACLDMAVDYAKNRYAFSRQIGSFQAIKHKLADMYVATEVARSNAYYGAWALSTEAPELPLAAAAARVAACDAYHLAAKENIQTHGGMGFTWEVDCHLFYRRAKLLAVQAGSPGVWKEKLVRRLELKNAA